MNTALSFSSLIEECGVWGIVLVSILAVLFFIQLFYYLFRYGRFNKVACKSQEKTTEKPNERASGPISLVTVMPDTNYYYLESVLPAIQAQENIEFEIVLVDLACDVEFSETLKLAAIRDPRINLTILTPKPQFPISNKMALNVGIKAARNENVLLSTTDIAPPGPNWLSQMGAGFASADIVLGYCGVEEKPGTANKLMRLSNMESAMRWVSFSIKGKPYRGSIHNLGIRRTVYFDNNGFNFLNLNVGEDDLFIQYVSRLATSKVVVSSDSVVRRKQYGNLGWMHRQRLFYSNAYKYYPSKIKWYISGELWTRALFFIAAIAAMVMLPLEVKLLSGLLLLLRYIVVRIQASRAKKIFSETKLLSALPLYDIFSPIYEAILAITRRMYKTPGLWR